MIAFALASCVVDMQCESGVSYDRLLTERPWVVFLGSIRTFIRYESLTPFYDDFRSPKNNYL